MSTKTFLIAIVVIIAAFLLGLGFIIFTKGGTPSGTATTTNPGGIFGGEPGNTSGGTGTSIELPVTLSDGSTARVPDFTKQDQPAIAGPKTGYQVAGNNTGDFQILYFPDQSYFNVTLNAEPLGSVRLAAETALRQKLGLSDADLCKLNSQVAVPYDVNQAYAGRNLGLSFCPGSVQLP